MDYGQFREKFLDGHFGIVCQTVEERFAVVSWLHENEFDLFKAPDDDYTRRILFKTADAEFLSVIFLRHEVGDSFVNYYRNGYRGVTEEMSAAEFLNVAASEMQPFVPKPIAALFT